MNEKESRHIEIINASENNLKNISLTLPHNKIIAITGVSGSGKSSLAFNIIAQIGQKRFLETFSEYTKAYLGKVTDPKVERVNGITPVVSIAQKTSNTNSRSTVGTLLDIFDYFKILYSRLSPEEQNLSRSHFSFNNKEGACLQCNGLGLEEFISVEKLIENPNLTLREGALVPTLPNGYIVYSQVTVEVLNEVCKAHGFSVDIAWNKLTKSQKDVILFGSEKLKVPFGKHSLESRLKWTGIKAKPREEGFYKGMLPTMNDILRRDRNKNILRFVEAKTCAKCQGKRYNNSILKQELNGITWDKIVQCCFVDLLPLIQRCKWKPEEENIVLSLVNKITETLETALALGLGHLSFQRASETLSGGELQRLRTLNQVTSNLSGLTYVFDEPSIGLHPAQNNAMIEVFKRLKRNGNTVIVVEHDLKTIAQADWIVEIGPLAGKAGGEVVFNGPTTRFIQQNPKKIQSQTLKALFDKEVWQTKSLRNSKFFELFGCNKNNLKQIDVQFLKNGLNCVAGVSGAGKSTLILQSLVPALLNKEVDASFFKLTNAQDLKKVVVVDQKPIGRTSRSNPATYTKLADKIRDVFSQTQEAKAAGFKKSNFSFNTKGGRCEKCLGTGEVEIGMHFLSNVRVPCDTCNGKRFKKEVLKIKHNGFSISDVYRLRVDEAIDVFNEEQSILTFLHLLQDIGLGYLSLGQSSTTLSGGEAQRVKLVSELHKQTNEKVVYVLDEPSVGLHQFDLKKLITILKKLVDKGNTVICITHNTYLIKQADYILELGPGAGEEGGRIVAKGSVEEIKKTADSKIRPFLNELALPSKIENYALSTQQMEWVNVHTHNLKNITVTFPKYKLNVITGVSGSGKTSFAIHTLFSEAQSRYAESLSNHVRGKLKLGNQALFDEVNGLTSAIKIDRKTPRKSDFSTVGTLTGIYDSFRLLFSRMAQVKGLDYSAKDYSFNQKSGACLTCDGKGFELRTDTEKLITNKTLSVESGLFLEHKATRFYANPNGQYYAVLKQASSENQIDLSLPWENLTQKDQDFILYGNAEKEYTVVWKTNEKEQLLKLSWLGFANYLEHEYQRRKLNKNIKDLVGVLAPKVCLICNGDRIREPQRSFTVLAKTIGDLSKLTISELRAFLLLEVVMSTLEKEIFQKISAYLLPLVDRIISLGLGYITINRSTHTLSGGEFQRIHLAGQLANRLSGVTYVIDEPTVGLHPKNYSALFTVLEELKNEHNTLLVIEHNPEFVKRAEYVIEFGLGAGENGGSIIHQGSLEQLRQNPDSIYKHYLDSDYSFESKPNTNSTFGIRKLTKFNLPELSASFFSNSINALTGLSGSGKSTLVKALNKENECAFGLNQFETIVEVSQEDLRINKMQTPVSYLKILEETQKLFAQTKQAKEQKMQKAYFSYTHKEGRCLTCKGQGTLTTAMDFMQDVEMICNTCDGRRFNKNVLNVKFKEKNSADVLDLTFKEAARFFKGNSKITSKINALDSVGLDYLRLGQPLSKMSSGEKQRLKLAAHLTSTVKNTLFVFDEPSIGLHPKDIEKLIAVFKQLKANGNTLLFVEHNPQLIAIADSVVNLSN